MHTVRQTVRMKRQWICTRRKLSRKFSRKLGVGRTSTAARTTRPLFHIPLGKVAWLAAWQSPFGTGVEPARQPFLQLGSRMYVKPVRVFPGTIVE